MSFGLFLSPPCVWQSGRLPTQVSGQAFHFGKYPPKPAYRVRVLIGLCDGHPYPYPETRRVWHTRANHYPRTTSKEEGSGYAITIPIPRPCAYLVISDGQNPTSKGLVPYTSLSFRFRFCGIH